MIDIEIVYARDAYHQKRYSLSVPSRCTIEKAIELSNIALDYPEIQSSSYSVGIWSKAANLSDELKSGDRLEIYRPLSLSAMEARRARNQKESKKNKD